MHVKAGRYKRQPKRSMSKAEEHHQAPISRFAQEFGFTANEELFDRVSDKRFREFISSAETSVHAVGASSNNYGEFLFVTLSRPAPVGRHVVTFYGLGYHDYRERWFVNEWFWYRSDPMPLLLEQAISQQEAEELLRKRLEEINPYVTEEAQSERAQLFELLADLTDEDGAYSELEDMGL